MDILDQTQSLLKDYDNHLYARADAYFLITPLVLSMIEERAYMMLGLAESARLMNERKDTQLRTLRCMMQKRNIQPAEIQQWAINAASSMLECIVKSDRYAIPRLSSYENIKNLVIGELDIDAYTYQKILASASQEVALKLSEGLAQERYITDQTE